MNEKQKHLVEMRGVKLQFADNVVLKGLDLSLKERDVLVILGESGCGKSTLLRLLLGLLKANGGSIRFQDKEVTKLSRKELNQILATSSGQPLERIDKDTDRDFYLNAKEAIEYGLADKIVEKI